ncbi:MAG: hypothetical protein J6A94_05135 [Lachnospiraceae bacterium]|nr:hypothetical protein [Lachnospiraceae bacterium]
MDEFLAYITIFQIATDLFDLFIGSSLIFGALKWRKGLLSATAFYWGLVLGLISGVFFTYVFDTSPLSILIMAAIGAIIFPIFTYVIPAVNRFVLGFIVVMKLLFMFTTVMCKDGNMELTTALTLPLILGTLSGIIFMFLKQLSVLPFVLGCVFIGASQFAPTIAKYINQFIFGITHDYSLLFDPIDFIFALFKIELTDGLTLLLVIIFMCIGIPFQLHSIKKQGYGYDTPIIAFETDDPNMHGKIVS